MDCTRGGLTPAATGLKVTGSSSRKRLMLGGGKFDCLSWWLLRVIMTCCCCCCSLRSRMNWLVGPVGRLSSKPPSHCSSHSVDPLLKSCGILTVVGLLSDWRRILFQNAAPSTQATKRNNSIDCWLKGASLSEILIRSSRPTCQGAAQRKQLHVESTAAKSGMPHPACGESLFKTFPAAYIVVSSHRKGGRWESGQLCDHQLFPVAIRRLLWDIPARALPVLSDGYRQTFLFYFVEDKTSSLQIPRAQ